MHRDFCTQQGVDAFNVVLETRQHHLGLQPGAGELRSLRQGSGWGGRCRSQCFEGDQTWCARAVPGGYLSWDGAATPPGATFPGGWILLSSPGFIWAGSPRFFQLPFRPPKSCNTPFHP